MVKKLTPEEQAKISEEDFTEFLEWTAEEEEEFMRIIKEQDKQTKDKDENS